MIGGFALFAEGVGVVGGGVYFVDDFEIVTIIFNLGLELYRVIFGIFLDEYKDGERVHRIFPLNESRFDIYVRRLD